MYLNFQHLVDSFEYRDKDFGRMWDGETLSCILKIRKSQKNLTFHMFSAPCATVGLYSDGIKWSTETLQGCPVSLN